MIGRHDERELRIAVIEMRLRETLAGHVRVHREGMGIVLALDEERIARREDHRASSRERRRGARRSVRLVRELCAVRRCDDAVEVVLWLARDAPGTVRDGHVFVSPRADRKELELLPSPAKYISVGMFMHS